MNGGEWFFLESGRQMGPVPLEQLVTLLKTRLPRGTLVWRDGMADWLKAEEVAELAASLGTQAAPLPPPPPPPAPRGPATASSSARVGSPIAASRPAYRPVSTAPRGPAARADDDEPHTLNPFVLFARCFRFAGRFDRGQFAIAYFGGVFSFYATLMAVVILGGAGGKSDTVGPVVGVAILLLAPVMIGIAFGSMVRRLHDIGQPGWYSLLIIVPCLGLIMVIYLLAAPGTAPGAPAPSAGAGMGVAGIVIAVVAIFGGIALIGIVAAIAIPSLLRARVAANEAATIGDIRSVISAQAAYQSMNGGFFEGRLECLARPGDCLSNSTADPLVDASTIASPKSGYVRELVAGPAGRGLPAGLSRTSVRSFAFAAHPVNVGQTGIRSFCGDSSGRICYDPAGGANLVDKTSGEVMCSMTCQDLQ